MLKFITVTFIGELMVRFFIVQELTPVLCDDLQGWSGGAEGGEMGGVGWVGDRGAGQGGQKEAQEKGYLYVYIDSCFGTAKTNTTL